MRQKLAEILLSKKSDLDRTPPGQPVDHGSAKPDESLCRGSVPAGDASERRL